MPDLTITTVQGIGDLFWCYQKLSPLYPGIHFNVLTIDNGCKIQTRASEFLTLLPKHRATKFTQVDLDTYNRVTAIKPTLPDPHGRIWFEYAVNAWLESGVSLYEIDQAPVEQRVELIGVREPARQVESICVFVAGHKGMDLPVWKPHQWADACELMAKHFGADGFDFIGADWDHPQAQEVIECLRQRGWPSENLCGRMGIAESLYYMRSSKAFLGFQSGLGILAENYDVPQLMVYFDHLEAMMHTWKKPGSTSFHATTFGRFGQLAETIAGFSSPSASP